MKQLRHTSLPSWLKVPQQEQIPSSGEKLLVERQLREPFEPSSSTTPIRLLNAPNSPNRTLDFDIETRKVGFHQGGRFNPDGCEPIAIACSWAHAQPVGVKTLDTEWREEDLIDMLEWFKTWWDQATMVTGHYIRKFDLPILNGAMAEMGLPLLGEKMSHDTKIDAKRMAGLSLSQENLAYLTRIEESKFHMNDGRWRRATRLTPEGLA